MITNTLEKSSTLCLCFLYGEGRSTQLKKKKHAGKTSEI